MCVFVSGANFGYSGCDSVSVSFRTNDTAPTFFLMLLLSCTTSTVTAMTPVGYGQGLSLVLVVGSQSTVWSQNSFGYRAPNITGLVRVM